MNYVQSANTAKRLLANFGQPMILTQTTNGAYDANTGTSANTQTNTTASGVILPYANGVQLMPNATIQSGDAQVLINLSIKPKPTDTITVQGEKWTVINVKELAPAGTTVLFDLQVRK